MGPTRTYEFRKDVVRIALTARLTQKRIASSGGIPAINRAILPEL
jgi:hypothetical protein